MRLYFFLPPTQYLPELHDAKINNEERTSIDIIKVLFDLIIV